MNYLRLITLWCLVTVLAHFTVYAQQADVDTNRYVFSLSRLSIPRQVKTLRFVKDTVFAPDGTDVSVNFQDPANGVSVSLYVYKSPPGTKGPILVHDSAGKPILEDREEIIKRYNAVFKLTEPSKSFADEYALRIKSISDGYGYRLKSEYRCMAVPGRDDSPIAYVAKLSRTKDVNGTDMPFIWTAYLYSIPGYFVKIHYTCPEQLWLEIWPIVIEFIQAINWDEILPPEVRKEAT
jgi:hypothetical protein